MDFATALGNSISEMRIKLVNERDTNYLLGNIIEGDKNQAQLIALADLLTVLQKNLQTVIKDIETAVV